MLAGGTLDKQGSICLNTTNSCSFTQCLEHTLDHILKHRCLLSCRAGAQAPSKAAPD